MWNHPTKILPISLLAVMPALCLVGLSAKTDESTEVLWVDKGHSAYREGQTGTALDAFSRALQEDDSDIAALIGAGTIHSESFQHTDAFRLFDRATKIAPNNLHAWSGRGLAAFNLEDFDEALVSFETLTAQKPVNGFYYESLAWTHLCRKEFQLAANAAREAVLMYNRVGESPLYPLLIAHAAQKQLGAIDEAARTLQYAQTNKTDSQWPAPIVDYLSGTINESELISFVQNLAEETEARTYIGLHLLARKQNEAATRQLDWVGREGYRGVFEFTLARSINLHPHVAKHLP